MLLVVSSLFTGFSKRLLGRPCVWACPSPRSTPRAAQPRRADQSKLSEATGGSGQIPVIHGPSFLLWTQTRHLRQPHKPIAMPDANLSYPVARINFEDFAARGESLRETISVIKSFIKQCEFQPPHSAADTELRCHISDEVASWNVGLIAAHAEKVVDTSCLLTETAYAHTSPEHRYFVARYTAYFIYADDLGDRCVEALNQFPRLFVMGHAQLDPVLDRLAELIKGAHELWTNVGANAIITGTLDALTAYHIELTTRDMVVRPGAVRYPDYLRLRTGIDPPFIAFVFMRGWRATAESYLQFVPDMEWWIGAANDVLSFYKEELENETTNYVHIRAAVEQSSRLQVLQKLADEVLETQRRLESMMADDEELAALWRGYVQRYLEFSIKTPRYRLAELGFTA